MIIGKIVNWKDSKDVKIPKLAEICKLGIKTGAMEEIDNWKRLLIGEIGKIGELEK